MIEIGVVGHADHDLVATLELIGENLDRVLEDHGIGNDGQFARQAADVGFAQGDPLDLADNALAFDHVPDPHLLAQHDQHTGEEVLEDILKCKADRDRTDSEPGNQARRGEGGHHHDRGNHDSDQPDSQLDQRVDQRLEAGTDFGPANQHIGNFCCEARQNPGDEQDEQRDRDAGQRGDEARGHCLYLLAQRCDVAHDETSLWAPT